MLYLNTENLYKMLDKLRDDFLVYVPVKKKQQRYYQLYRGFNNDITLGEVRPFEPLKSFFFRSREIVADGFNPETPSDSGKPVCVAGVKACDLKGFKVQDHVFGGQDCPDPFYLRTRDGNLIISCDCTCAIDTCFCLALGVKPYPQRDYDINLSPVSGGFLVEIGSAKGQKIIDRFSTLVSGAGDNLLDEKENNREAVIKAVEKNIKDSNVPDQDKYGQIIDKNYNAPVWEEEAKTCVECGACNTICPTCHCFLLYDQKDEKNMKRLRVWDSCLIKDFARVAGGANPRKKLWMRLRNRFEKKFDFFPKVTGVYACTGCGRCISACPAKIDIRRVLKKLVGASKSF